MEEEEEGVREKRRRVEFRDVTIYNFKRRQGLVCVPSQVRLYLRLVSSASDGFYLLDSPAEARPTLTSLFLVYSFLPALCGKLKSSISP